MSHINTYTKECDVDDRRLFFYGAEHSNNPEHPQFAEIEHAWADFIGNTKDKRVAIGEISVPQIPLEYSEVIKKYGEAGALYFHAKQHQVDYLHLEPDVHEQRRALCGKFPSEQVAYAMILQNLASWFHHERGKSFEDAISFTIQREAGFKDIYNFTPDREWFDAIHKTLHADKEITDKEFLQSVSDPRKKDTEVNLIVGARTQFRNEYILEKIVKEWESGKSIFIVYGRGHLDALKEELEKWLKCDDTK